MTSDEDSLEVGIYRTSSSSATVYLNQLGICIYRARITLLPEHENGSRLSASDLMKLPIFEGVGTNNKEKAT